MTVGGLYLLGVLFAIAVLYVTFKVATWETWDDKRRSERLVQRNLKRMGGWS